MSIRAKVEQWEAAGITDEATGRVGSSVRVVPLLVPDNIRVEGDRLYWDPWDRRRSPSAKWVTPDAAMFNAFLRIAKAKNRASAVLRFAKRYGVFSAKDFGLRSDLDPAHLAWWPNRIFHRYTLGANVTEEPLAAWDEILEGVIALLNIGSSLALNPPRTGTAEDWAVVVRGFDPQKESLKVARMRLSGLLNDCLGLGDVRIQIAPAHAWDAARPSRWTTTVAVGHTWRRNLFGVLALQAMLAVAGIDLYCCAGCNLPYVRSRLERRPKANQNNYCADCRKSGAPVRAAVARHRQKKPARPGCAPATAPGCRAR